MSEPRLSPRRRHIALALAASMIPAGRFLPAAGERAVTAAEHLVGENARLAVPLFLGVVVTLLDWAAVLRTGHRFINLDADARDRLLRQWQHGALMRWPLFALGFLFKTTHLD